MALSLYPCQESKLGYLHCYCHIIHTITGNSVIVGPPVMPVIGTVVPSIALPTTQLPTAQPTPQTTQTTTASDNDMATLPTAPVIDEETPEDAEESEVSSRSRARSKARTRTRSRMRTRNRVLGSSRFRTKAGKKNKGHSGRSKGRTIG